MKNLNNSDLEELAKKLQDDRQRSIIFVHRKINDIGLTPEAFRVYFYLLCLPESLDGPLPLLETIGNHCFRHVTRSVNSKQKPNAISGKSQTALAKAAWDELLTCGLIEMEPQYYKDGTLKSHMLVIKDI